MVSDARHIQSTLYTQRQSLCAASHTLVSYANMAFEHLESGLRVLCKHRKLFAKCWYFNCFCDSLNLVIESNEMTLINGDWRHALFTEFSLVFLVLLTSPEIKTSKTQNFNAKYLWNNLMLTNNFHVWHTVITLNSIAQCTAKHLENHDNCNVIKLTGYVVEYGANVNK